MNATVTAKPLPVITGDTVICLGTSTTFTSASGSTWGSSDPFVATIATVGGSTGVVTPVAAGTTVITCILSGCITTETLTVNPLPAVTVISTELCGGINTLIAGGASTYSWSPASGLSCTNCSMTNAAPSVTTIYTVTGTIATGCSDTASVWIDANLISGYISYGSSPHDSFRVYLYQFNPTDTSLITEDSTLSCLSSGTPYYEFEDMPAGDYMVQAKLIGQVPGTTGYIPTFSMQTPYWNNALSVVHTNTKDTMHLNMVYNTVPPGPGFISGYISTTTATPGFVPAPGVLVLLLDGISGSVITFTYTDASGNYSFSNIAVGNYIIYPEEFGTIPPNLR